MPGDQKKFIFRNPFLLLVTVTLVYSFGLNGRFIVDDSTYFVVNDLIPNLHFWQIGQIFLEPSNYWGELLPVRDYLYVIEYSLFRVDPFGYHVVSLLLYLAIVGLAWRLVSVVSGLSGHGRLVFPAALFAAAFFAFHPTHVETVAYISGQKDLLCAIFSFLSLILFFRFSSGEKPFLLRHLFIFLFCYYSAFLSKNLAVSTSLLLTVSGLMLLRSRPSFWTKIVPIWVGINLPVMAWLVYNFSVSSIHGQMSGLVDISIVERSVRAVRIVGQHLLLAVWPQGLNFGYPFDPAFQFDGMFFVGGGGLLLLLALFFFCRDLAIRLAILLIVCYLLPVSQLFFDLFNASIYDRYLFIPVLGVGMLVGRGLEILADKLPPKRVAIAGGLMVVVLLIQTCLYIPVYSSDVAISKRSFENYPDAVFSIFNYVTALIDAGELEAAGGLLLKEDLVGQPPWVAGYFSGWIAFEQGALSRAIPLLRQSYWQCAAGGYYPFPGVLLARSLIEKGHVSEARMILDQMLNLKIHNPVEYYRAKQLKAQLVSAVGS